MHKKQKLTERQAAVLEYITEYIDMTGYAPTAQEIAEEFNITLRPAQRYIERLDAYGYIRRVPNTARGIILLDT